MLKSGKQLITQSTSMIITAIFFNELENLAFVTL